MDDKPRLPYDETPCPSINETVKCVPESAEFAFAGEKFRLTLVSKTGRCGWEYEPAFVLEKSLGDDARGQETWVLECSPHGLLGALFMKTRPILDEQQLTAVADGLPR